MLRLYQWAHARFPTWVDCRPIDAGQALQEGGFRTAAATTHTLWGLPVQVVLGVRADA
jgi:demethylmenaquinone methyltransferase/2-methoxy-6-polyprenyl-1,4-benzoquinol methylase